MYYNDEAGLIYLAHPRTASRATRDALTEQANFQQPSQHGDRHRLLDHHATLEKAQDYKDFDPEDYLIFTTVRNHFSLLLSWYFHSHVPEADEFGREWLDGFMEKDRRSDGYFPEKGRLFALHGDDADVLLRFEEVEEDLNRVLIQNGLEPVDLPVHGVTEETEGKHYRDFYSDEFRRHVEARFKEEMEELGYEW